jgi:hypothetical protein
MRSRGWRVKEFREVEDQSLTTHDDLVAPPGLRPLLRFLPSTRAPLLLNCRHLISCLLPAVDPTVSRSIYPWKLKAKLEGEKKCDAW